LVHASEKASRTYLAGTGTIAQVVVAEQTIVIDVTLTEVFPGLADTLGVAKSQRDADILLTWGRAGIEAGAGRLPRDVCAITKHALVCGAIIVVITIHRLHDALPTSTTSAWQSARVSVIAVGSGRQLKFALPVAFVAGISRADIAVITWLHLSVTGTILLADIVGGTN
jgi:hypothetical protein